VVIPAKIAIDRIDQPAEWYELFKTGADLELLLQITRFSDYISTPRSAAKKLLAVCQV
jgi:hypothetical protein